MILYSFDINTAYQFFKAGKDSQIKWYEILIAVLNYYKFYIGIVAGILLARKYFKRKRKK